MTMCDIRLDGMLQNARRCGLNHFKEAQMNILKQTLCCTFPFLDMHQNTRLEVASPLRTDVMEDSRESSPFSSAKLSGKLDVRQAKLLSSLLPPQGALSEHDSDEVNEISPTRLNSRLRKMRIEQKMLRNLERRVFLHPQSLRNSRRDPASEQTSGLQSLNQTFDNNIGVFRVERRRLNENPVNMMESPIRVGMIGHQTDFNMESKIIQIEEDANSGSISKPIEMTVLRCNQREPKLHTPGMNTKEEQMAVK
jgi:hypothetical protein